MMRVAGVAVGRYLSTGSRRVPDSAAAVAQMVNAFTPGSVPILDGHAGELLGWLDHLEPEQDRDLRLMGAVVDRPDIAERLRVGIPISIEAVDIVPPGSGVPLESNATEPPKHWRGDLAQGWNVIGVALCATPDAPGSFIWSDLDPPYLFWHGNALDPSYPQKITNGSQARGSDGN